jgi:hypothetical protein
LRWADGDLDLIKEAMETVTRVAKSILSTLTPGDADVEITECHQRPNAGRESVRVPVLVVSWTGWHQPSGPAVGATTILSRTWCSS